MMKLIPDGNRRLALVGGFAIGVAFAENDNAGTDDVESTYVGFFSIGGQGEAIMLIDGEGLERIVRKHGSDHCLCYVGEKVGLEKNLVSGYADSEVTEARVTMDTTVRSILGAVYLDVAMSGVREIG